MTDTIFNSFIQSVYTGGSAMELFDNLEIIGGADDISVESIFGGYQSDELADQDSESDITKPDDSDQHPDVSQIIDERNDETKSDSKVNEDEISIVSSIDMTLEDDSFGKATEGDSFGKATEDDSFGGATEGDSFGGATESDSLGGGTEGNSFDEAVGGNSFGKATEDDSFGGATEGDSFGGATESDSFDEAVGGDSFGEALGGNSSTEALESDEATEGDSFDISIVEPYNLKLKQKNEDSMSTSEIAEYISRYD